MDASLMSQLKALQDENRCLKKMYAEGDLELTLRNEADLEKARPLLERSYQES